MLLNIGQRMMKGNDELLMTDKSKVSSARGKGQRAKDIMDNE